jgi:hypothetical protein
MLVLCSEPEGMKTLFIYLFIYRFIYMKIIGISYFRIKFSS